MRRAYVTAIIQHIEKTGQSYGSESSSVGGLGLQISHQHRPDTKQPHRENVQQQRPSPASTAQRAAKEDCDDPRLRFECPTALGLHTDDLYRLMTRKSQTCRVGEIDLEAEIESLPQQCNTQVQNTYSTNNVHGMMH